MIEKISAMSQGACSYVWKHVDKFTDRIVDELGENRTLLCWVYAAHYLALCWWCVIKNPSCMATVITVSGTLIGAIFTSYVFGTSYEKATKIKSGTPPPPAANAAKPEAEHGASD